MSDSELQKYLEEKIADLKKAVDAQDVRVSLAETRKTVELQKELFFSQKEANEKFRDLKADALWYKLSSLLVGLLVAVLALFGFKEWINLQNELSKNANQVVTYQIELAKGLAFYSAKEWGAASVHMKKAFEQHPGDESIEAIMLISLMQADRWPDMIRMAGLIADGKKVTDFSDPWLQDSLGIAFLYQGRDDPDELIRARAYLETASNRLKGNENERAAWFNLWVCDLFMGDELAASHDFGEALRTRSTEHPNSRWSKS